MITKHKVENFIIVRPGTAVPTPADRVYDFTTDVVNIPVGGFGVYQPVANSGNKAATALTPTISTANTIQIIQHRDKSNDGTPLYERSLEQSPEISPDCYIKAVGTAASTKTNNLWAIGDQDGNAGAVPVFDETEYTVNAALNGWRTDLYNGLNTPLMYANYTTPDYFVSTLYTTTIQRRDHLLQNLAFNFNQNQNVVQTKNAVALCVDTQATATPAAGNGIITLAAAAALSPGDAIIIGFTDLGQPIKLIVDADLIATFAALVATPEFAGTEQLIPYAHPTATNLAVGTRVVAGGRAAGTPDANVDMLLFIALDEKQATYDEVSQTKERILLGLDGGFDVTTRVLNSVLPNEGSGYAKDVLQLYRDTHGHRKYIGGKVWQPNHVEFPSEIVTGGIYDIFIIESCFNRVASSGMPSNSPQRTIVAILNTETVGFTGYTGAVNPQKTYFQDLINSWVASTPYPHTTLAL